MTIRPDTAVLWALDAAKPGAQVHIYSRGRTPAGALTTQLTQRIHETGRRFEQQDLQHLTHHQVEDILQNCQRAGWAQTNSEAPRRWIITQTGLDECQRRRTGQA
jgi:hypothetical protein